MLAVRIKVRSRRRYGMSVFFVRLRMLYQPPFALTVLAAATFAGRTRFSAFNHDAMLRGGVWRFAYTPYEDYRRNGRNGWWLGTLRWPSKAAFLSPNEGVGRA